MKIARKKKMKVKLVAKNGYEIPQDFVLLGKVLPEVDGPVRERAVLVNKDTDKLSTCRQINILRYVDI